MKGDGAIDSVDHSLGDAIPTSSNNLCRNIAFMKDDTIRISFNTIADSINALCFNLTKIQYNENDIALSYPNFIPSSEIQHSIKLLTIKDFILNFIDNN